jgi:hypothetical protein
MPPKKKPSKADQDESTSKLSFLYRKKSEANGIPICKLLK